MCANYIRDQAGHRFLRVGAPTGNAAFNVDGSTLHSMFQLPIEFEANNPAPKLSGDQLDRLQHDFKGCGLLVIDEKSMISTTRLYQIDCRLREAFPEHALEPFGGLSIVIMGDYR